MITFMVQDNWMAGTSVNACGTYAPSTSAHDAILGPPTGVPPKRRGRKRKMSTNVKVKYKMNIYRVSMNKFGTWKFFRLVV